MCFSEDEEVVEQLGEGGMLSLEQGVIDPTTEEGKARLEELDTHIGGLNVAQSPT